MTSVSCSLTLLKKFPAIICIQIRKEVENALYYKTFRAKKKGQAIVHIGGIRYSVIYHKYDEHIELTDAHSLKRPKYSKSGKKEARLRR